MALRENPISVKGSGNGGEMQSDASAGAEGYILKPDNNGSHSKAMVCRDLVWSNIVLCIVLAFVALLLALPLMIVYLPTDDVPDVRSTLLLNYDFPFIYVYSLYRIEYARQSMI